MTAATKLGGLLRVLLVEHDPADPVGVYGVTVSTIAIVCGLLLMFGAETVTTNTYFPGVSAVAVAEFTVIVSSPVD